ncbi:3-methyl-2-oxobutanoate dehydrogenase subunit beta [Candidatus Aminicenantes bacterium AH-873-B07]|nr:3-methyl-2-oxobutanoate dehydrogenase subunit beta [Candidatus Aminicenantes bacterium AH-873-B07]
MKIYEIPEQENMRPGHLACPGCGAALAMRYVLKALGDKTIISLPACCWSVIDGPFPYSSLRVPLFHCAFETAASTAAGVRAGLDVKGKEEVHVLAWAGDGGTFDIGIQALSGAAERNENIIYVCYDNEAYMNTGIQRSSATPFGAWTTTTPVKHYKNRPKKDIVAIMAAHRIPYVATTTVGFPNDLIRKMIKAKDIKGTKFIHIYAPCPTGWKCKPDDTIKISKLVVETAVFPLYEIEDGEKYTLNFMPKIKKPVSEYLKMQGRFRHLTEKEIEIIQKDVDFYWKKLLEKCNK